jgi:4-amino-4-deoxy-L-arabinose transferase-like glycosyltransferase
MMGLSNMKKNHRWVFSLIDALFLALLLGYVFLGLTRVPFHGDESTFIGMSMDWEYIFEDRDPQKAAFHPNSNSPQENQRLLIGSVNPLTIWMAWKIAGMSREDINGMWIWYSPGGDEWVYNIQLGNMPDAHLLDVARFPSTLFCAASIIVIFVIALVVSRSRPAAWVAAFLYATTPSVLVNGRRAMQEGAMLFFSSLVILLGLFMARELRATIPRWRRLMGGFVLLGFTCGFALASKHTSALIIVPVFLMLFLFCWVSRGRWLTEENGNVFLRLLAFWLGAGFLGLAVFYVLMPAWWSFGLHWLLLFSFSLLCFLLGLAGTGWKRQALRIVPILTVILITALAPRSWSGVYCPIQISLEAREVLTRELLSNGKVLPTTSARIHEMARQLLVADAQYYESYQWDNQPGEQDQIRIYENAWLDGRGGGKVWGTAMFLLIVGGVLVVLTIRRGWEAWFLLLWAAVPTGIILITNLLAWQRYYLVLIAPWSVLAGFGVMPLVSAEFRQSIRRFTAKIFSKPVD